MDSMLSARIETHIRNARIFLESGYAQHSPILAFVGIVEYCNVSYLTHNEGSCEDGFDRLLYELPAGSIRDVGTRIVHDTLENKMSENFPDKSFFTTLNDGLDLMERNL